MTQSHLLRSLSVCAALAAAAVAPAQAAVADFETQTAFACPGSSGVDNGLAYTTGFVVCYYSPADPADFDYVPLTSTIMAAAGGTTFSLVGGGSFDLDTIDLSLGRYTTMPTEDVLVTGNYTGGGSVSTTVTLAGGFSTVNFDWLGLSSLHFATLGSSGYVAFDNIRFDDGTGAPVSAPGTLALAGLALLALRAGSRRSAR